MKHAVFIQSLSNNEMPEGLNIELKALWLEKKGKWAEAHELVDSLNSPNACRVHAYLHRVEGDDWNANYWYRRASTTMPPQSTKAEWESLVLELTMDS